MKMFRSGTYRDRGNQQVFASNPSNIWWDEQEQCVRFTLHKITDFNQPSVTHDYYGTLEVNEIEQILSELLEAAKSSDKLPAQLKRIRRTLFGLLGAGLEVES